MNLWRNVVTLSRTVGSLGYRCTYGAVANPAASQAFLRAVANTIVDFRPELPAHLPKMKLDELCPRLEDAEFPIRISATGGHGLPLAEYLHLAGLVQYFKPKTVFEIGTNRGRTTRMLAERAAEDTRVYTLDLPPDQILEGGCFEEARRDLIGEAFLRHPIHSKITQLFGNSRTFDFSPFYGRMELVFIDGDHRYDGVKHDTEQALRMVAPGGLVVWDDYHPIYGPDVMRYLEELAGERTIHQLSGTRLACHRSTEVL